MAIMQLYCCWQNTHNLKAFIIITILVTFISYALGKKANEVNR